MRSDNILFLATKTLPPRRTRSVLPRPRLVSLAKEVRHRLLTVVKGPPGYGKTTLGLAWSDEIAATGAPVAWLSLDASDNDVNQCAFYIAATLNRACPAVGGIVADMLAGLSVAQPDRLIALLINDLAEQPQDVFLFLDDCHHLTQPAVVAMLTLLLSHASENLHVVMLGRSDPPRSMLSLISPENLLEVDAGALRFDLQETNQLACRLRDSPLTRADVHDLHATTEGWPAAVRAILLSLADHGDPHSNLKRIVGNHQPISALMEYLLDQIPAELAGFMVCISVVDKVCASLAEALTGEAGAQQMLETIERRQLFLSARDNEARWFAFHPLFREQLERRLRKRPALSNAQLHRRAADWFARQDLWSDAVGHALSAGDTDRALRWIEQCAMRLVESGELVTLLSWQSQLRDHLLESPLRLRLAFAWGLAHAMAAADAWRLLEHIERDLRHATQDAETENLRWECQALRSLLTNINDDKEAAGQLAREYLDLAREPRDTWITNVMLNVVATTHLKAGRWESFYAVPPLMLGDKAGVRTARYVFNVAYRLCYRGLAEYFQGRLDDAASLFEEAMRTGKAHAGEQVQRPNLPHGRVVWALPAGPLAQVRYQQGRFAESTALIVDCLELVRIVAPLDFAAAAFLTASRLATMEGKSVRARTLLEDAERLAQSRAWPRMESSMLLERTRLCLLDGRFPESSVCLKRLDMLASTGVNKIHIARDAALAHAWALIWHGKPEFAIPGLQRRLDEAWAAGTLLESARLAATLALAHLRMDDRRSARLFLQQACQRVAGFGAVQVFFDLPAPAETMQSLLRECVPSLPRDSALAKFLLSVDADPPAQAPAAGQARQSFDSLSVRERHILTLLAKGCSNKEIARGLGVAPETVKYHLKSVFSKLDVRNRVQAAAQLQRFGHD